MLRRRVTRFPVVTAIAVALLAFMAFSASNTMAQDDVVVLIGELNGSGISGDASLTDNGDGTTTVDILVDGATGGHPAHIHSGTCSTLGDVVYPLTDVDASGQSVTVIDTTLADLQSTGPYAINIHLSAGEIGTYVACGDIPQVAASDEVAAAEATATLEATPAVGGTSSVTDIGTSGIGTTATTNNVLLVLVVGSVALFLLAGAFELRRRAVRG